MKGRDAKGVDVGFEGDSVDLEGQRLRVKYVLNTCKIRVKYVFNTG